MGIIYITLLSSKVRQYNLFIPIEKAKDWHQDWKKQTGSDPARIRGAEKV